VVVVGISMTPKLTYAEWRDFYKDGRFLSQYFRGEDVSIPKHWSATKRVRFKALVADSLERERLFNLAIVWMRPGY